jgi:hypothetical protein
MRMEVLTVSSLVYTEKNRHFSLENVHTIVPSICHDDVAFEVNSNVPWGLKLTLSTAPASYGAQARPIAEAQHLHTVVFGIHYDNVSIFVQCDCKRAAELVVAAAFGSKCT